MSKRRNRNHNRNTNTASPIAQEASPAINTEEVKEEKPKGTLTILGENLDIIEPEKEQVEKGMVRHLKERVKDLDRLLRLKQIEKEEYDYELSQIVSEMELLEAKHGIINATVQITGNTGSKLKNPEGLMEIEKTVEKLYADTKELLAALDSSSLPEVDEIEEIEIAREPLQTAEVW
ncbi:MAG: hypothetical protein IJI66_10430 [Erysipelotrichaceae bacterium]|nr:hypothetical protein [Erysipelotrichaceae bacterium]